jgi:hypothetical protein
MHDFRIYWISLYMFRMGFPSIIRSSRLYIQHQVYVIHVSWLLASKQPTNLYDIFLVPDAVCAVLNSWWWTERPSETCRVILNKLENRASSWFYYRNHWLYYAHGVHAVAQLVEALRYKRKIAGSIANGVNGIFHWHYSSGRTMALGSNIKEYQ